MTHQRWSAVDDAAEATRRPAAPARRKRRLPPLGALVRHARGSACSRSWPCSPTALPFIRDYNEKVKVDGEVANRYALGPGWDAWFGTDALGQRRVRQVHLRRPDDADRSASAPPSSASSSAASSASSPATSAAGPTGSSDRHRLPARPARRSCSPS